MSGRRWRSRRQALTCAVALLAWVGAGVAAQHVHVDDHEDCSICAISASDHGHAPPAAIAIAPAPAVRVAARPVLAPRQRHIVRHRQRAPPLSI